MRCIGGVVNSARTISPNSYARFECHLLKLILPDRSDPNPELEEKSVASWSYCLA
jgi:hypothetical protein